MTFVNLHHHDTYSQLDGFGYPELGAARATALGMPALAQTNHGNMFGAFAHYRACKKAGIKPILGMEAYVAPGEASVRERVVWGEAEDEDGKVKSVPSRGAYTHLTLLAQNAEGLRNLYRLHEASYLEGYYYHPRVDKSLLDAHRGGLIVLSGCVGGEISTRLRLGQVSEAEKAAEELKEIFGDKFFLETMFHDLSFEPGLNYELRLLSDRLGIPMVATCDSHYPGPEHAPAHTAMVSIAESFSLSGDPQYYVMSEEEMLARHDPDVVHNSGHIADMIGSYDEVFEHKLRMPEGDINDLRDQVYVGLHRLYEDVTPELQDQAEYELDVIDAGGYAGYFQVVADILRWANNSGIFVGYGRGSGASSLVAYSLGITRIDPIQHGLVFERFLNPERQSPPDIDSDFESARQLDIFAYASERFGPDRFARILTLGTIKARRAIQDAAKILGYSPAEGTKFKSYVPPDKRGRSASLAEASELAKTAPDVYSLALEIEGQVRQTGLHAGGCVISPAPLGDLLPVKKGPNDAELVTGFTMEEIEELGLVKIDILGIKTLDIVKTCLEFINA